MGLYVSFAPFLLGAVFFSLSFNFLFSICYALLSFKYLSDMPNKVVKKKLVVSVILVAVTHRPFTAVKGLFTSGNSQTVCDRRFPR